MSDDKVTQVVTEYWVSFKGVDPTTVPVSVVQALVNSRGDEVQVMDKEQTKPWAPASEWGFFPSKGSVAAKIVDRIVEEESVEVEEVESRFLSQDESIEVVLDMDDNDQITVLVAGREVATIGRIAKGLVQYKGAVIVRGSFIRRPENHVRSNTAKPSKKKTAGKSVARPG